MNGEITFGQWLTQRREARNLTQEELADRIGCSSETIHKIEAGWRGSTSTVSTVAGLASRMAKS